MMRTRSDDRPRPAFTLLEVLLAAAIGVLLMGALYAALTVQLRYAANGRDVVEQSTVARAILNKMGQDIVNCVRPNPPASSSGSGGSGGSAGAGTGGSGSSGAGGGSGGTGTGGSGSTASSSSSSSTGSSGSPTTYSCGLQGDNGRVVLYLSRWPRELFDATAAASATPTVCDQRRVTYWLAGASDTPLGLARQESTLTTSDDQMGTVPPDGVSDETPFVIAEEVRSLTFRFYDGSSWQDSWDGTTPGADGKTPQGPPVAVEITLVIVPAGAPADATGTTYRHVVVIPTANGAAQNTTNTTTPSAGGGTP